MASWENLGKFDYLGMRLFTELQDNIVAYQRQSDNWFSFPCSDAAVDWAKCLFDKSTTSLLSAEQPPTFFLFLESNCSREGYHSNLQLVDFIRFLRLSKYHPEAWSSDSHFNLWSSPVVCFSFETRERILPRSPESLILYSPSVQFRQLPLLISTQSIQSTELPKPAEDMELSTYVNSIKILNLSAHHGLGDVIGPYSILSYFRDQLQQAVPVVKPAEAIGTDTLQEMFTQIEQEKISEIVYSDQTKATAIATLWGQVKESAKVGSLNKKRSVLILDDQSDFWGPMWQTILGGKQKFTRKNAAEVSKIFEDEKNGSSKSRCEDLLSEIREHALLIMDLRLDPDNDRYKKLEDVSGYRLLTYIRGNDAATPILMFTSSQRGRFHQQLISVGADAVCIKPTRLDNAPALLEILLEEIESLLKPEYKFLRYIYFELEQQKHRLQHLEIGESIIQLGLAAWKNTRRNAKQWLSGFDGESVRESSLSDARIIGIVNEQLKDHHENLHKPEPMCNYYTALRFLRNAISHPASEHAFSVHIGCVALELFVKLLSCVDQSDITIKYNPGYIFSIDFEGLIAGLKKNSNINTSLFQPSYRNFCGSVQAASLLHGLTRQGNLRLDQLSMKPIIEAQQYANKTVEDIINNTAIAASDIKQAIYDYAVKVNSHPDYEREVDTWLRLLK